MAAAIPLVLTGAQMFQQYKAGKQQEKAIEDAAAYTAEITKINQVAAATQAEDALNRGDEDMNVYRNQIRGLLGSQAASIAGAGVDVSSGSAAAIMQQTARDGEMDALKIKRNAMREAHGIKVEASNASLQGNLYQRSAATNARASAATGGLQALGTLAQGAQNYYNTFR